MINFEVAEEVEGELRHWQLIPAVSFDEAARQWAHDTAEVGARRKLQCVIRVAGNGQTVRYLIHLHFVQGELTEVMAVKQVERLTQEWIPPGVSLQLVQIDRGRGAPDDQCGNCRFVDIALRQGLCILYDKRLTPLGREQFRRLQTCAERSIMESLPEDL